MVEVVNRSQQVKVAGMHPASAYSRLLMFRMVVLRVGAMRDGGVTTGVGQSLRILGVDIWFNSWVQAGWMELENSIMFGSYDEPSLDVIRDQWDPVMRYSRPGTRSFFYYGETGHMHFNMNLLLMGKAWRFGLVSQILGTGAACFVTVGIEISEG